jgi:hypothetical protein
MRFKNKVTGIRLLKPFGGLRLRFGYGCKLDRVTPHPFDLYMFFVKRLQFFYFLVSNVREYKACKIRAFNTSAALHNHTAVACASTVTCNLSQNTVAS